jgi:hypothetical protein
MEPPTHLKIFNPAVPVQRKDRGKKKKKKKNGTETEEQAIQRPPHLGIYPNCRQQTANYL